MTKLLSKLIYFSIALSCFLFVVYWLRPDWVAAITVFPAWVWLVFWVFSIRNFKTKPFIIANLLWSIFTFIHIEEVRSLFKVLIPIPEQKNCLKVLSINCSSSIKALEDAFKTSPDVILLQESPNRSKLEAFVHRHDDYTLQYGVDTSILVRGAIQKIKDNLFFTSGVATVDSHQFLVFSLRLKTSEPRVDLWNWSCWTSQMSIREKQIAQIKEIKTNFRTDMPMIVGGDFNVPQGDRIFSVIGDDLQDSFSLGGRGFGNTVTSDFPVLRIDQIWISKELRCPHAFVSESVATDHWYYIACIEVIK